ncbi:hypothetical protein C7H19_06605 [Aphanothece hegewaldii CCALA 016]|uniref:Uncharacterized protein n=1 Tax=Aphanothece hegewaldii CCALA 016 TaxID=2107694 RepID=A0A2T1M0D9_9CHRO|nr:hypothetical protein [Aphanothece hegewaldii]PSF38136.1 hypothetical protein C7H19_06605 [Aphanothece hegewaldii CCALA 016]
MAIILQHLSDGNEYIFLGIGVEGQKNSISSRMLGEFFAKDVPEKSTLIAACDSFGKIVWLNINDVIVVEVDGEKPAEILPETIITTPSIPIPDDEEKTNTEEKSNLDEFPEDEDWI